MQPHQNATLVKCPSKCKPTSLLICKFGSSHCNPSNCNQPLASRGVSTVFHNSGNLKYFFIKLCIEIYKKIEINCILKNPGTADVFYSLLIFRNTHGLKLLFYRFIVL